MDNNHGTSSGIPLNYCGRCDMYYTGSNHICSVLPNAFSFTWTCSRCGGIVSSGAVHFCPISYTYYQPPQPVMSDDHVVAQMVNEALLRGDCSVGYDKLIEEKWALLKRVRELKK